MGIRGTQRCIALPLLDHDSRRGWGVSVTSWPHFTPGKTQYSLYRMLGGPQCWSGQLRKLPPPTGIPSPYLPARSQSLYRLRYSAHSCLEDLSKNYDTLRHNRPCSGRNLKPGPSECSVLWVLSICRNVKGDLLIWICVSIWFLREATVSVLYETKPLPYQFLKNLQGIADRLF